MLNPVKCKRKVGFSVADHGEYKNETYLFAMLPHWILRQIVNSHIFMDQFIIFQYSCRCCIWFNNRLNFVWVLTCQLMDIISLFIVWHWFKYKILADALEGSTLGHKICRRFANKCVLLINVSCFIFTRVCHVLWVCTYWQLHIYMTNVN